MKERIAIIDLGTNTFNLLIVDREDNDFKSVYSAKEGVGLGLGGINSDLISKDAMERGMEALRKYQAKCKEMEVNATYLFGTSAVRNASNKSEFLDKAKKELDYEIEVISGLEEAELTFKGVSSGFDFDQPALIMDIGGGSTEFILADKNGVMASGSFEIGVSRIYQKFTFSDPYTLKDTEQILEYLEEKTNGFFDDMNTNELIGSSGSFETFYELTTKKRYPDGEFVQLSVEDIIQSLDHIIASTQKERNENKWIIPIRKKMAPIAAVKIKWIVKKLNIKRVTISPFALKEGVLQKII